MNTLEQPSGAPSIGDSSRTNWRHKKTATINLSPENLLFGESRRTPKSDKVTRKPDLLESLGNLAHDVLKFHDLKAGIDYIFGKIACCLPLEHFHFYELDSNSRMLKLVSHYGSNRSINFIAPESLPLSSLQGWCFQKNYEQHCSDELQNNPRWNATGEFKKSNLTCGIFLSVPGLSGPIGVIGTCSATRHSFNDDQVRFLKTISGIVSGMATRIRLSDALQEKEREILSTEEGERVRISQELHDGLCYSLMALKYKAAALEGMLKNKTAHSKTVLDLEQQINDILTSTRQFARKLHPDVLETRNLVSALSNLASNLETEFSISCAFFNDGENYELPAPVENNLCRIAQEAVMNGLKHGEAKQIKIHLRTTQSGVELQIENDGISFDLKGSLHRGMGLRIMNYRARAIGATVSIKALDPQGTLLTCTLPR